MNWRLASRFSVLTMALLIVLVVAVLGARTHLGGTTSGSALPTTANSTGLQGTDLGCTPAPNSRLTDQFGKPISLSQFKGKPCIMTLLYTSRHEQSPLT